MSSKYLFKHKSNNNTKKHTNTTEKFILIMSLRSKRVINIFINDKVLILSKDEKYRKMHENKNAIDIWLNDLREIVDAKYIENLINIKNNSDILKMYNMLTNKSADYDINQNVSEPVAFYVGSIFMSFLCIWEAEKGSKFILTDRCFGMIKMCGNLLYYGFLLFHQNSL